ncbi:MAG: XisI protein [Anaerolineales bacterium]|nr:XisI protein [Anaerolineales bacterium]
MERVEKYRHIVEKVLQDYVAIPYTQGNIENELLVDRNLDKYILLSVGWSRKRRVHSVVFHIDIIDGKVWVQVDNTDAIIVDDLEREGIPKEDIVLGFHEPEVRQYTGYAVA